MSTPLAVIAEQGPTKDQAEYAKSLRRFYEATKALESVQAEYDAAAAAYRAIARKVDGLPAEAKA